MAQFVQAAAALFGAAESRSARKESETRAAKAAAFKPPPVAAEVDSQPAVDEFLFSQRRKRTVASTAQAGIGKRNTLG
jgi:hypothetical protein